MRAATALRPLPKCLGRHESRRSLSSSSLQRPLQSYISLSRSPLLNLSFEHHLLLTSPPTSTILFLYVNAPSIIIGRNQNPWLEVNLHALRNGITLPNGTSTGPIELVRRRSGGGTVFHDAGNVNWTIISPSKSFTRDKSVEMVVRALRGLGVHRARVNERHDVVLDRAPDFVGARPDQDDTHRTAWTLPADQAVGPLQPVKVSGSAYKLTRNRALHHGTCLLRSSNLGVIPQFLRSPAKSLISAKGVESVSSPVSNVGVEIGQFIRSVQVDFARMYGEVEIEEVDDELRRLDGISNGMSEMKTAEWVLGQTPQFVLEIARNGLKVNVEAKHGKVLQASAQVEGKDVRGFGEATVGRNLAEGWTWQELMQQLGDHEKSWGRLTDLLDRMLPTAGTLGYGA